MDFSVALAQIKPKLGCVADNLGMVEAAVVRAIQEKAGVVLFPELALTGVDIAPIPPSPGITFIQGDALEMTFEQRYDAVVSLDVIEHVLDIHSFVKGLGKLCAPGGIIIEENWAKAFAHSPSQ